jgi:hypothetical protein
MLTAGINTRPTLYPCWNLVLQSEEHDKQRDGSALPSAIRVGDPELDSRHRDVTKRCHTTSRPLHCRRSDSIGTHQMTLEPPSDSRISVTTNDAHPLIVFPHKAGGVMRYFVGLFLLAWLGGWLVGFSSVVSKLSSGWTFDRAHAFLVCWLVAWTLGGAMAVYWIYRAFRPSVPESLRLMPNGVTYDSGIPPLPNSGYTWNSDAWKSMVQKRTRVELDRQKLQSLRLRETKDGNRLTVDANALRLDIAQSATEIEREWLYKLLTKRYSLPLPQGQ